MDGGENDHVTIRAARVSSLFQSIEEATLWTFNSRALPSALNRASLLVELLAPLHFRLFSGIVAVSRASNNLLSVFVSAFVKKH